MSSDETQFKPGNRAACGHGRPRTKPIREAMQRALDDDPKSIERIARMVIRKAAAGDVRYFVELRDMFDGKPRQELSGPDGGAIPVDLGRIDDEIIRLLQSTPLPAQPHHTHEEDEYVNRHNEY